MTSAPIRYPLADHLITPQVRGAWRMGRAQGAHRGIPPGHEFTIGERELTVTVIPGLSVISVTAGVLASVRDLRATAFVDSPPETRAQVAESGWTTEVSLGASNSLLARDPDGMLAEFVEISAGTA